MKKMITIKEAAEMLGVSNTTLREWDRTGKLKPHRTLGNHRRYDLVEIESILEVKR